MTGVGKEEAAVILTVDLGTTSAKVLAIETDSLQAGGGRDGAVILARAEQGYPLLTPAPGYAEQNPDEIAAAAQEAIREAVARIGGGRRVEAVAFSSAMHALIAVDREGRALTPSITWADLRAAAYARKLRESGEAAAIARRAGVPMHAMTPLAKLLWLRDRMPDVFGGASRFIGIKEYVLERWFGRPCPMDESVAGGTGLYSMLSRDWDDEALALAGVGRERLPELAPTTHVLSGLAPAAAAATGLAADTPFVLGGADGPLANLGAGATEPGVAALTIGTSGAVRAVVRRPEAGAGGRLFCYPLADDYWVAGGSVNSGGVIVGWLKDKLAPDLTAGGGGYAELVRLALETPPGAGGLLFLPHLSGERAPYWDERARGVFFGLSLDHDRRHMLRAGLEGILLHLRSVTEALSALTGRPREIRASGGFVRSEPLRQLMADVLGCPIVLTDSEESSSIGAARLALLALGRADGIERFAALTAVTGRREPNPATASLYGELHEQFRALYGRADGSFASLAKLRERG